MYSNLSEKNKSFFQPGFLGLNDVGLKWLIFQISLLISSKKSLRRLLMYLYPKSVFLSLVALTAEEEVVGFAYIKIMQKMSRDKFKGLLGMFVRETHHGKGFGKELLSALLKYGVDNGVHVVTLTVSAKNEKAIGLYTKCGFKITQSIDKYRYHDGEFHSGFEMIYKEAG